MYGVVVQDWGPIYYEILSSKANLAEDLLGKVWLSVKPVECKVLISVGFPLTSVYLSKTWQKAAQSTSLHALCYTANDIHSTCLLLHGWENTTCPMVSELI